MRAIVRPTAILASGSVATVLVAILTAKAWAVLVGPSGMGLWGLLQSLLTTVAVIGGVGVTTAIVRELALARNKRDEVRPGALRRAGSSLVAASGLAVTAVLVLGREPVASLVLNDASRSADVGLAALAVIPTLLAALNMATLNGYQRVTALARATVLTAGSTAVVVIGLVWMFGSPAIPAAVVGGALTSWVVSALAVRASVGTSASVPEREFAQAARALVGFGAPYAFSMLIGVAAQLALPVLVLHQLGPDAVGYYRAATAVSVGYLGFLLVAMSQEYFPRLSAISDRPEELARAVANQQRLIALIALPVVLAALAVVPLIVPVLYTSAFTPTNDILELQLVGDILKLPAWAFAYVLLAQRRRGDYLLVEVVAAVTLLGVTAGAVPRLGLAGIGLAYVVTYALYYPLTWVVTTRTLPLLMDRWVQLSIVAAFVAGLAVAALPVVGESELRVPVGIAVAGVAAALAIRALSRGVGAAGLPWQPGA